MFYSILFMICLYALLSAGAINAGFQFPGANIRNISLLRHIPLNSLWFYTLFING